MSKIYKTLAVTLAVTFTTFLVSRHVKALPEALVGGAAVTAAGVAITGLAIELIAEICNAAVESYPVFKEYLADQFYLSDEAIEKLQAEDASALKEEATSKFNGYMEDRIAYVQGDAYYQTHYKEMSEEEIMQYFLEPAEYYKKFYPTPTLSDRVVYSVLGACVEYAPYMSLSDIDYSLSLKSNVFSNLYDTSLENAFADIYGHELIVSRASGKSLRYISMHYPGGVPEYFPSLAVKYGAKKVYKDEMLITGSYSSSNTSWSYIYYILSDGFKVAYAPDIGFGEYAHSLFLSHPYTKLNPDFSNGQVDFFVYYSDDGSNYRFYNNYKYYYLSSLTGQEVGSKGADTYWADQSNLHIYMFEFNTEAEAQAMCDDLLELASQVDTSEAEVENPAFDIDFEDKLTHIEQAVGAQQGVLDTDEDLDIVINPGLSITEDGEAVYNPSISIADTDIKDIVIEDEKVVNPSFDIIPGYIGVGYDFPLYDQCKLLLENLFNYNDVVNPPSFKFYWDSNGDGESEVYDVLDLSFLETSLSNEHMQDKSWWSISIRIIDLIRYIIAAVIYGLFVMRLIKRLPFFYGGGYWSSF